MAYEGVGEKVCAQPECTNSFKTDKWHTIHAAGDGWFMQKDGTNWCPDHTPAWVAAWRKKRDAQ